MTRIKRLMALKESLDMKTVEAEIESLIEAFWKDYCNEDLYQLDLGSFSHFHQYLMGQVIGLHLSEVSQWNHDHMMGHLSFKEMLAGSEDGKIGHKMYLFNKDRDYYFIGDLHSDDVSLKDNLRRIDFYKRVAKEDIKLIFTGDYVDRGRNHLKVLERLMILKILFPKNIFILRGNHDGGILNPDGSITLPYRVPVSDVREWYFPLYLKTLAKRNETVSLTFLSNYMNFFDHLAYAAIIENAREIIFAVHGGLPRPKGDAYFEYLEHAGQITDENHVDHLGKTILQNIMWSDPYRGGDHNVDSGRFRFTEDHYLAFKERFAVDLLIRGHEVCNEGYRYHFDESLITIFSSGGKMTWGENLESAYKEVTPKVLLIESSGVRDFL